MTRFDFTRDAVPDVVDRLRSMRVPEELHGGAYAIAAACLFLLGAFFIEDHRLGLAEQAETAAQIRLDQSRNDLAKTRLQRLHVDALLDLDQRLRDIRLSGTVVAARLADIANHVPEHAWLTSISRTAEGTSISGRVSSLGVLSETVADLMSSKTVASPSLVRAGNDEHGHRAGVLSFEVRVVDRAQ